MAEDLERGDRVAHMAYGSAHGDTRVIFRYRDSDITRVVENGEVSEGEASPTPTWWR